MPPVRTIQVIEPCKEVGEPDPAAVPFGFSRALEQVRDSGLILPACVDVGDLGDGHDVY